MNPRPDPPSGATPPATVESDDGAPIDLAPLAARATDLYFEIYPDDVERYGEAGRAWCDHDSRYLLAWALEDARASTVDCVEQVQWLGRVLGARNFPLERLVGHVTLIADVLDASVSGGLGGRAAARMRQAASSLMLVL
jgi:hypothetical protein